MYITWNSNLFILSTSFLEHMEFIPEAGTSMKIADYPIEVMQVKNNMVKTVRLMPQKFKSKRNLQVELPLNG